jgi:hypothetical protein
LLSLAPTLGCSFLRSLAGENTISLEGAEVKSIAVDLRRDQKTICPRARVQMAVFVEAKLKGEKQVRPFETWNSSRGLSRNGTVDFNEFAFHSDLGTFDAQGWFSPNPDVIASAGKEFLLTTAYKRRPDLFSFETRYKPDYSCVKEVEKGGAAGPAGNAGPGGDSGKSGQSGGSTGPGERGGDGGDGGPGQDGGDGADGPRIEAFATFVKTPFYDRLLAVRLTGDINDLLLAPADRPLVLRASGGAGGDGGPGGNGGRGGSGGSGTQGGKGGTGGRGGPGGNGGRGGKGGEILLRVDERFPELASLFRLDVGGGPAGPAGPAGLPGSGGSAGPGTGSNGKMGATGNDGPRSPDGRAGAPGAPGRASTQPSSVLAQFQNLGPIEPLGAGPAPAPAPPSVPGNPPASKDKPAPKGGKK